MQLSRVEELMMYVMCVMSRCHHFHQLITTHLVSTMRCSSSSATVTMGIIERIKSLTHVASIVVLGMASCYTVYDKVQSIETSRLSPPGRRPPFIISRNPVCASIRSTAGRTNHCDAVSNWGNMMSV